MTARAWQVHGPALVAVPLTAVLLLAPIDRVLEPTLALAPGWLAGWLESGVASGSGFSVDKLVHLLLFFVLTGLAHRSLSALEPVFSRWPILCAVATTAYGGGLELLQGLLASRSAELADGVADAVGALLWVGSNRLLRPSQTADPPPS